MPSGRSATSRARSTPAATTRRSERLALAHGGALRVDALHADAAGGVEQVGVGKASRCTSSRWAARSRPSVEVKTTPQPSASLTASAIAARSPPSRTMWVSAVWSASARSQRGDRFRVAYQVLAHFMSFVVRNSHSPSVPRAVSVWGVIPRRSPWPHRLRVQPRLAAAADGPRPVLHASATAIYVDLDGWCLGLVSATATRVPCALWSTLPDLAALAGRPVAVQRRDAPRRRRARCGSAASSTPAPRPSDVMARRSPGARRH